MTSQAFVVRKAWRQIDPDARVRTVLFRFAGSEVEWAEIFVDERYETIAQQEQRFRREMTGVHFITPLEMATVAAKNWKLDRALQLGY